MSAGKKGATFVKTPPWLYRPAGELSPGFTEREKDTYHALREHHRENGKGKGAVPSEKTVAGIIGVSERTVRRAIKGLEDKGAVIVTVRPGTSNRYDFPDTLEPPTQDTAGGRGATLDQRLTPDTIGGRTPRTQLMAGVPMTQLVAKEVDTDEADTEKQIREGRDGAPAFGESSAPEPSLEPSFGEDDHPLRGARDLGYNEPSPDPVAEASAVDVVNRVNLLAVRWGRNPVTDEQRPHWLKSSRLLLSRHSVEEVVRLLDWAGDDGYWGGRIDTVFALAQNYDALLRDSLRRDPRPRDSRTRCPADPEKERRNKQRVRRFATGKDIVGADTSLEEQARQRQEEQDRRRQEDEDELKAVGELMARQRAAEQQQTDDDPLYQQILAGLRARHLDRTPEQDDDLRNCARVEYRRQKCPGSSTAVVPPRQ